MTRKHFEFFADQMSELIAFTNLDIDSDYFKNWLRFFKEQNKNFDETRFLKVVQNKINTLYGGK